MDYLNVFDYLTPVEHGDATHAFEADADACYPAALADMLRAKSNKAQMSPAMQAIMSMVNGDLTQGNIDIVLAGSPGDPTRALFLEAARLWFTEKIKEAVSQSDLFIRWTGSAMRL
jgi:hypothetical protein